MEKMRNVLPEITIFITCSWKDLQTFSSYWTLLLYIRWAFPTCTFKCLEGMERYLSDWILLPRLRQNWLKAFVIGLKLEQSDFGRAKVYGIELQGKLQQLMANYLFINITLIWYRSKGGKMEKNWIHDSTSALKCLTLLSTFTKLLCLELDFILWKWCLFFRKWQALIKG